MGQKKTLIAVLGVCLLFLVVVIGRIGSADINAAVLAAKAVSPIPADKIYDPAAWGKYYPLEYASYLEASDMSEKPGNFGGSIVFQNSTRQPEMLVNFKGMPFSVDYAEDRGHVYAVPDTLETKRINKNSRAACMTCKTPYVESFFKEYGWDYASKPFSELISLVPEDNGSISCANCHDPNTMELRIINPAFIEAQERRGIDMSKATVQDMRSYVCAQCHSEYFFEPGTFRIVFPWDKGFEVDKVYEYYAETPYGFKNDWVHPDSQALMLKVQHPEFEAWTTGIHGKAGVSCADCHMPYMQKNGQQYSHHRMSSPLRTVKESCISCHDQEEEWMIDAVKSIQDNFWVLQRAAGKAVAQAHEAIMKAAAVKGADESELNKARELVRKAQWYWDYVAAENSMGFHNPSQGMKTTGQALDFANQAILTAYKAAGLQL